MELFDCASLAHYLRETGRVPAGEPIDVCELSGGVSNNVFRVDVMSGESFVVKQARPQLKTAQPWFCSPERIWREVAVLKLCGDLVGEVADASLRMGTPRVLFEDRERFLFAMTAAPAAAVTWKTPLLAGDVAYDIAAHCGRYLAALHGVTNAHPAVREQLADQTYFSDLRLDPYYGEIRRRHPALAPQIDDLIAATSDHRHCLVHGDFSPKNMLVSPGAILLIDCEVGHYGDPAFDLGFFLTHLTLKAIHLPQHGGRYLGCAGAFWWMYATERNNRAVGNAIAFEPRVIAHWRACLLARVDGKSPVEYLTPEQQHNARRLALAWFAHSPGTIKDVLQRLFSELGLE